MFTPEIIESAARVLAACRTIGLRLATAEILHRRAARGRPDRDLGSSEVFDCAFVVYSNGAKQTMLGVSAAILDRDGAVSRSCAEAMAEGALAMSPADITLAVTGIAGPGGGSAAKPVGLVHFAGARRHGPRIHREVRFGDIGRGPVRMQSVAEALAIIEALVGATS